MKATNARSGTVGLDLLLNKTYTSTLYAVSGSSDPKVQLVTAFEKARLNEISLLSTLITTVEGVELGFQCSFIDVDLTRGGWKTKPSGILPQQLNQGEQCKEEKRLPYQILGRL